MKKRQCTLLLFLIILFLILTACGKKAECTTDTDCVKTGFLGKCINEKCEYAEPGICGNKHCETGESKCNCPADCGKCEGTAGKGLEYKCIDYNCTKTPASQKLITEIGSVKLATKDTLRTTTQFNDPHWLGHEQIQLTLELTQKEKGVIITRIELFGEKDNNPLILTEKDLRISLIDMGEKYARKITLTPQIPAPAETGQITDLELKIYYEYPGADATQQASVRIRNKLNWLSTGTTAKCPTNCDDNNPGTTDSCGPQTLYFCEHEPETNKCGNYLCETGENECNCPIDCGKCQRMLKYVEFYCEQDKCLAKEQKDITSQPRTLLHEFTTQGITFQNRYKLTEPMNQAKQKIQIEILPTLIPGDITNAKLDEIKLLDKNLELASTKPGTKLNEKQPQNIEIELPQITTNEQEIYLTLALYFTIEEKYREETKTETEKITYSLGKTTIIRTDT